MNRREFLSSVAVLAVAPAAVGDPFPATPIRVMRLKARRSGFENLVCSPITYEELVKSYRLMSEFDYGTGKWIPRGH